MANVSQLIEKLNSHFNGTLELSEDEQAIYVQKENIVNVLQTLKESHNYFMLADLTCVDYEDRFEVVYHLVLKENADLLRVKVKLPKEAPKIASAVPVWKAADVQEREAYDLMGIVFEGHPDMKRILLSDDFVGHPLRKDFKLETVSRF